MTTPFTMILLNEATPAQINAVHETLKEHAKGWWHHFENAWIVGGDLSPGQWLDVVTPLIPAGRTSVLVVQMPADLRQRQSWAYYGIDAPERSVWLNQNLGRKAPGGNERAGGMPSS